MSTLSIRLPESLHQQIRILAKNDNISINQFIASAAAEKMAALMTQNYLEQRAQQASREKFLNALAKVADVEPDEKDCL